MKNLILLYFVLLIFACQGTDKQSTPTADSVSAASADNATTQKPAMAEPKTPEEKAAADKASKALLADMKFKSVVMKMTDINYELKNFKNLPVDKANLNLYVNVVNAAKKYKATPIDMSNVTKVKRAFVKGTQATKAGGDTYPRASIEAWVCADENIAKEKIKAIDTLKKEVPWDVISKSPITYWQDGNMVFLLTPGGMYMLDEVPKIRKFLEEQM